MAYIKEAKLRNREETFKKLIVSPDDKAVSDAAEILGGKLKKGGFKVDLPLLAESIAELIQRHQHDAYRKELGIVPEKALPKEAVATTFE